MVSTSTFAGPDRSGPGDLPGRLHPVHPRHPDVHQHHVGLQRPHLVQRLLAVPGLADHARSGSASRIIRKPVRSSG